MFYLMSMLDHAYDIIIGHAFRETKHIKDVVDGLNAIDKIYLSTLMDRSQFTASRGYDNHVVVHTSAYTEGVSIEIKLQIIFKYTT